MGLTPKKARSLMERLRGAGATDVAVESFTTVTHMIRFANSEISVAKRFDESSVKLYVAFGPQRAVLTTTDLTAGGLKRLSQEAVRTAKSTPPSDLYAPLPSGPFSYDKGLLDQRIRGVTEEKLVGFVEGAVNEALNAGAKRVAGTLVHRRTVRRLVTSGGVEAEAVKDTLEISVRAFLDGESSGQFAIGIGSLSDFNPEKVGREAGEIAKMMKDPVEASEGRYDAIIGPMTAANLIEEVGSMASAFYVDSQFSFLTGKLGEKVAHENFTLIDDPTVRGAYGSEPFDEEGVPTRKKAIIENGVLRGYLHNSATARKFGTESTGNAGIIVPSPFNLVVEGGGTPFSKLISKVDNGIMVTNDWYLRYRDVRSGEFSTIPRDGLFLVRHGSIERALKGLRISDNMLRILAGIEDMSAERYPIVWWEVETPVLAPYLLVREVNFTRPTS
ncbi:MAG: TldD/PmbA family protein [Nitrososphaerota archaeon]